MQALHSRDGISQMIKSAPCIYTRNIIQIFPPFLSSKQSLLENSVTWWTPYLESRNYANRPLFCIFKVWVYYAAATASVEAAASPQQPR